MHAGPWPSLFRSPVWEERAALHGLSHLWGHIGEGSSPLHGPELQGKVQPLLLVQAGDA